MIFHINQVTYRDDLSEEQRQTGLELLYQAGAANPTVKSFVVGPEIGGEFDYCAAFVFDDLDGYEAYLNHPVHVRLELEGMAFLAKFAAFDASDSDDPKLAEKIAAIQARHLEKNPDVAALIAEAASFTVPDGSASAA